MTDPRLDIDREEAARVLRRVRLAGPKQTDEAIDWAFSVMPHSRPLQRLRIRRLLDQGDLEGANALIGRGLLKRPTDSAFTLLRAESLASQGGFEAAKAELRLALKQRPNHIGTLRLAAEVADRLGDSAHAVRLLERAVALRPYDEAIKALLVSALIRAEYPVRAEAVHDSMKSPPPVLTAELRRCQSRLLDAVNVLENSIGLDDEDGRQDELIEALIDLLEEIGDATALQDLTRQAGPGLPRAHLRAGRAELSLGEFAAGAARAQDLLREPLHRREALHLLVVAAAETGRNQQARDALCELTATDKALNPRRMAECWLRAFRGKMLRRQYCARQAGADPSLKLLPALLSEAVALFEEQLADDRHPLSAAERAALQRHRAACLATLGRKRDANAALAGGMAA